MPALPPEPPQWHVRVEHNRLRFAAAHMATFGDACEPLHGHNYAVSVEVRGELTDDAWVVDFGVLKRLAREACEELDHRVLLQGHSRLLRVQRKREEYIVSVGGRRYVLPAADVLVLPADNTTAERIAQYLWERIAAALRSGSYRGIREMTVAVEEAPGQAAGYQAQL